MRSQGAGSERGVRSPAPLAGSYGASERTTAGARRRCIALPEQQAGQELTTTVTRNRTRPSSTRADLGSAVSALASTLAMTLGIE